MEDRGLGNARIKKRSFCAFSNIKSYREKMSLALLKGNVLRSTPRKMYDSPPTALLNLHLLRDGPDVFCQFVPDENVHVLNLHISPRISQTQSSHRE